MPAATDWSWPKSDYAALSRKGSLDGVINPKPTSTIRSAQLRKIRVDPRGGLAPAYFAVTLDVIDAITPEAVLNGPWSASLTPWRRAIQIKSV